MNHWVMDYETNSNCFLAVFEHYKTDTVKVFTIGKLRDDFHGFVDFLERNIRKNEWHISFNGLAFDAQLTEYILANKVYLSGLTGEAVARLIYKEAQDVIAAMTARQWPKYSEKKMKIKQIDVFKMNHWDNPAKQSSLKWIQCSMDWHNVQDMPIHHTEEINTVEQLQMIASYCRNDVKSTKNILHLCTKQVALRKDLTNTYNIPLYSASEPRISKELFLYFLSKKTGMSTYDLRKLQTFRSQIVVKNILLPYLDFTGIPDFEHLLDKFKDLIIDPNVTKGGFKYRVNYRGVKTDFGLGGVHGAKRGIYESTDDMIIMSSDVVSYYPNLAIKNKWSPAQFNSNDFCELYEWFFIERKKIPKSDPRNYVYKIILNSTYGLSNDKYSFLYDPEFTMRITINGQLSLMMLYTMIVERIPGAIPIMQNTDGVETIIPVQYKKEYMEICKEWETITNLALEHDVYQKLMVPDVNNYIGVFEYQEISKADFYNEQKENPDNLFKRQDNKYYMAKTKAKGRFEFLNRPLHKNKSFTVVSKALYNFFVHGIEPEVYLKRNRNIFDYCGQVKARQPWTFQQTYVDNKQVVHENLQKTIRYYVSNEGNKIIKFNKNDQRQINVEAGPWKQTVFNKFEKKPFEEYDIDERFYLTRIKKEITGMMPDYYSTQMKLEF